MLQKGLFCDLMDVLGIRAQKPTPGKSDQRPNFRSKLKRSLIQNLALATIVKN